MIDVGFVPRWHSPPASVGRRRRRCTPARSPGFERPRSSAEHNRGSSLPKRSALVRMVTDIRALSGAM